MSSPSLASRSFRLVALSFSIFLGVCSLAPAAEPIGEPVRLPQGETLLTDIGVYQVCWQSYGKPPVAMPGAWQGQFDPHTGICYEPGGRMLGRQTIFMHSPWRVPPGKTWVDYPLALPQTTPIRLAFGIAMSPDAAMPGKSDGVTFSCYLIVDGATKELMRRHHDKAQWIDYSFDLSPYAGRTITLRLQVEPGPRNDSSFDFSHFGDAKIVVGNTVEPRGSIVKEIVAGKAYKAVAETSLVALRNRSGESVTASNLLPGKNRIEGNGKSWRFVYEGPDCRLSYTLAPATGTLDDISVQIDDRRPFQPAAGGGLTAYAGTPGNGHELRLHGGRLGSAGGWGDKLDVDWEYSVEGHIVPVTWSYRIRGKSLLITAKCDRPVITRLTLGGVGDAPLHKMFDVPYFPGHVEFLREQDVFVCRCLDWTNSCASQCPQGEAVYEPKTDGSRIELYETGYLAVSPNLVEVLPNIPHPPSPHRELLGPRIMLDIWGHHNGTFQGDAENLRALKDNGIDHMAIIDHCWQRYGYDVKLPDHIPADPQFGGEEGMKAFGRAANDCGYIWSLHENYIDMYPDAPSYDPTARVLQSDGTPSNAWFNPGTKVQSFGLKCNRALGFAKKNSPEIHSRYGTTAAYLDVHTCVPPWHQLDHDASQSMAAMELCKVTHDTALFQFMRDTHHGPLFGEGANHFYWAGRCDGVEAQVDGGEDHVPLLDFDLLKLHPQMVNHGMGYYERWYRRGYEMRWGHDAGSMEQIDKYRAQELAYGHAGFVGNSQTDNIVFVAREHHLMHPVQRLYGAALPVEILYEVDGQWVTASAAVPAGETSRQRIKYDSGLTLWVNWRPEPWEIEGHRLPQWGFLALGPQTRVATELHGEHVADYAECPEYVFADARTDIRASGARARKEIAPRLASFKDLGGGRIRVSYEWIVDDTLDTDYHCFVHGINPASARPDDIVFQGDHALSRPTSSWRPGTRIVDGPHEMAVPATLDRYDLVIGLYKGQRVPLKGCDADDRVLLARLKLVRSGDKIASITAEPVEPSEPKRPEGEADFAAHMNRPGTWIDFGPVATDGAVKINREPRRLVLFPYPREKRFRASLDLKTLAPAADPARVKVRALAAGDSRDLGPAEFRWESGRLIITFGHAGAGRFVAEW